MDRHGQVLFDKDAKLLATAFILITKTMSCCLVKSSHSEERFICPVSYTLLSTLGSALIVENLCIKEKMAHAPLLTN